MNHDTTIVLADDHPIFRKGLRDVIEQNQHFRVCGEAENGERAFALITEHRPNVAILDIEMPKMSGIEVARAVFKMNLPTSLIILTMYEDENLFNDAMDAGVMGYILKDSAILEIVRGITKVAEGECFISSALTSTALRKRNDYQPQHKERLGLQLLSQTEKHILRLIAEDRTTREISELLHISPRTVDNHRSHICTKLNLTGVHALIRFAVKYKSVIE